MEDFSAYAAAALAIQGVPASEADLEVLTIVHGAFAPLVGALDAIDIAVFSPERALDPSRAP